MLTAIFKDSWCERRAESVLTGNIVDGFAGMDKRIGSFERRQRTCDDFVLQFCFSE